MTAVAEFPVATPVKEFISGTKKLLIGGEWVDAASGRTFATYDPANGEKLTEVAYGQAEDINRAVAAARRAFETGPWPAMKPAERERLIWRVGDILSERAEEFGQLEALDNGKSAAIATAVDTGWSADVFRYYAGWATKIEGSTINVTMPFAPPGSEFHAYTLREPVGVCGQIIPWNFPLLMAAWKLAPALAAGNTVVLKPAEQTPLTALLLGEVFCAAGFPPGVVNIVTGFGDAGAALAAHDDVDKVAFTGSTEVGKKIVGAAKGNLKKVSLELGVRAPMWSSPTPTSTSRCPDLSMPGCSTTANAVSRAPGSTWRTRSSTSSLRPSPKPPGRSRSVPASTRRPSWVRWCRRSSSTG